MRGRKPKPTLLHKLHGNPSRMSKDERVNEPVPVTGSLDAPPDWLNDAQQLGWNYALTHCPPGMLSHIDRGVLAVWVVAEDLHRRAVVAQNRSASLLVKAPITGTPLQSPYLAIINRQGVMMIKAAGELGFTPVSRPRIGAAATPVPVANLERTTHARREQKPRLSLDAYLDSHPDRQTIN